MSLGFGQLQEYGRSPDAPPRAGAKRFAPHLVPRQVEMGSSKACFWEGLRCGAKNWFWNAASKHELAFYRSLGLGHGIEVVHTPVHANEPTKPSTQVVTAQQECL